MLLFFSRSWRVSSVRAVGSVDCSFASSFEKNLVSFLHLDMCPPLLVIYKEHETTKPRPSVLSLMLSSSRNGHAHEKRRKTRQRNALAGHLEMEYLQSAGMRDP